MFEGIPRVAGDICLFAFGFKPGVECGLVDREDVVGRGVGRGFGEEGECIKCRGEETNIGACSFLISF